MRLPDQPQFSRNRGSFPSMQAAWHGDQSAAAARIISLAGPLVSLAINPYQITASR
jgi:hypothetical protein